MVRLGFQSYQQCMTYSRSRTSPVYALTLISDETSKDMGGLLQQEGRDFLFYLAGSKESDALSNNQRLSKCVSVNRKVHGSGPDHTKMPYYVCCGQYEVVDQWELGVILTYFKLLRLPGQPAIIPQEMYYSDKHSVRARGFTSTYKIYDEVLRMSCTKPCERINPQHVSNFPIPASSGLVACDICEVCGINGHQIDMVMCECCNERGKEVQACYTCLPQKQLQWLLDDPDSTHHWCCSFCRSAGLRPQAGAVFEDVMVSPDARHIPIAPSLLPPDQVAAGQEASSEAAQQPDLRAAAMSEPAKSASLPHSTPSPANPMSAPAPKPPTSTISTHTAITNLPAMRVLSLTPSTTPNPPCTLASDATPGPMGSNNHGHDDLIVLDGAGNATTAGTRLSQAAQKNSSLPAKGTKRAHSAMSGQSNGPRQRVDANSNSKRSKAAKGTNPITVSPPASGRGAVKQDAIPAAVAVSKSNMSAAGGAVAEHALGASANRAAAATASAGTATALPLARAATAPHRTSPVATDNITAPHRRTTGSSLNAAILAGNNTSSAGNVTPPAGKVTPPQRNTTASNGTAIAAAGIAGAPAENQTTPATEATASTTRFTALAGSADACKGTHGIKGLENFTQPLAPHKATTLSLQNVTLVGTNPAVVGGSLSTRAASKTQNVAATDHSLGSTQSAQAQVHPQASTQTPPKLFPQTPAQAQLHKRSPVPTQAQPQLFLHSSAQAQGQLLPQSSPQAQLQLFPQSPTQRQPLPPPQRSSHAQPNPQVPTQVATPAPAHKVTQAAAQASMSAQGASASTSFSAQGLPVPVPAPLSNAPVLAEASGPALHISTPGLQTGATAASPATANVPAERKNVTVSTAPATIDGLTAKANSMLLATHQLSKQQAKQLQATFGDVELMQDLRHMDGDLLNGQLRAAAGLNALQICIMRQVLCLMQQ